MPSETVTPAPELAAAALPEGATDLGHHFRWLHTGSAAYDAMVAMIDGALRTVDFEFYTVAPGDIAERFGAAMRQAATRGLRVRVLVDAFGSSALPAQWIEDLRTAGVDIRRFNPRPLLRWSFRNHRKLLVCDDRLAIVGGFNVAPEYEGDGVNRGWRDLGVQIEGPVAGDLARGFAQLFHAADLKRQHLRPLARFLRHQRVAPNAASVIIGGPGGSRSLLKRSLRADLTAATRVDIAAAYFLPTWRLRRLLRRAVPRGHVRLLLSGLSDVPVSRLAAQYLYPSLLRAGVSLWEYQPQVMHAKAFVVDDVVYVGSANLDTRSLQLNFELMLRLPSAILAAQLRERIDLDCTMAQQVPLDWARQRTLLQRVLQSWSHFVLARVDPYVARGQFRHLR